METRTFSELLTQARLDSAYPTVQEFTDRAGIAERCYTKYIKGEGWPNVETLKRIIRNCGIPESLGFTLQDVRAREKAYRLGVRVGMPTVTANIPELADRILREIEFELKRSGVTMMPRTQRVCINRITTLLKSTLEVQ